MSGDPFVYINKCALVIAGESFVESVIDEETKSYIDLAISTASLISVPCIDLRDAVSERSLVLDRELTEIISTGQRSSLLLVGGLLEGAITQIALVTLLEGYDVFVCADLTICNDRSNKAHFLERMRSNGAHVVTIKQVALELLGQEPKGNVRNSLLLSCCRF